MTKNTSSGLRQKFHPANWPDHLRQFRRKDPQDDGSARDVHDPHVWDDPDPSLRQKLTPDTVGQWLALLGAGSLFGGLMFYFYPVFAPTFRNPIALAGFTLVAYSIGLYLKGRQDGIRRYVELTKSIIYYGDEIDIRLGEDKGQKNGRKLFTPYLSLSYGGFNSRPLMKRDLPYDASKMRSNTEDDAGQTDVVDRLNVTTVTRDTDNFGKVHLTHAEDLRHDAQGRYSDRYTPMPTELDEDTVEDVNMMIDSLEHKIRNLERQNSMYEQSNKENENLNQELIAPQIQQSFAALAVLKDVFDSRSNRSSGGVEDLPDPEDILDTDEVEL